MSEKKLFVSDLKFKDEISEIFLIKYFAVMQSRDGKSYVNLILSDATGDIEARIWHNAEQIGQTFEKGHFVVVTGKVNNFQGRLQVIVSEMQLFDESAIKREDFVAKAAKPADVMYAELLKIVEAMDDVYLRDLLLAILHDPEIQRRLKLWPAGKTIHHAYESGLLEHILSCCQLAQFCVGHYSVNKNYVYAGCILHDICKIYELTDGLNTEYTEDGKLIGHLVQGIEIVERYSARIKGMPHSTKQHLKHILLSHHGELEYGSPKLPQTKEAFLVHLIDLMDSKMAAFDSAVKSDKNTGHWTGMVKHLGRILYKEPLPFFNDYRQETTPPEKPRAKKKSFHQENPKQNLGALLKDFKVKD